MLLVIQRVNSAKLWADGVHKADIGKGLVVFAGIFSEDSEKDIAVAAEKIAEMRIFENSEGKMSLSLKDIGGEALLVPNFTLCGDTSHGRRPDFTAAARPDKAKPMFEELILKTAALVETKSGVFGADMKIIAENDGPVTIIFNTENKR